MLILAIQDVLYKQGGTLLEECHVINQALLPLTFKSELSKCAFFLLLFFLEIWDDIQLSSYRVLQNLCNRA